MKRLNSSLKICSVVSTTVLFQTVALALQILAHPYIQPGNASSFDRDQCVIKWITDDEETPFKVLFGKKNGETKEIPYTAQRVQFEAGKPAIRIYKAAIGDLEFDTEYTYEVCSPTSSLRKADFRSRTRSPKFRFVAIGCSGEGSEAQERIAKLAEQLNPRFILHLGDFCYPRGCMKDYYTNIFPYYNKPDHADSIGTSLMSKIPFYLVFGNHDVSDGSGLSKEPDNLASFYVFDLPNNGPQLTTPKSIPGPEDKIRAFKENTGPGFETATNYSFDYGNAHFLVVDGNTWNNPEDPNLQQWIERDLATSQATWKIACIHQAPFSCTLNWIPDNLRNKIRDALEDRERAQKYVKLFQKGNVDLVLCAHVHNYERSKPIILDETGRMRVDHAFDGVHNTRPQGIPYIISGSGGAHLHLNQVAQLATVPLPLLGKFKLPPWVIKAIFNRAPYLAKAEHEKHSFTQVDIDDRTLLLRQIDATGTVIDEIAITK
jgi:hypothetical protein